MSKSAHESTVVTHSEKEVMKNASLAPGSTVVISFAQPDSDNPFDWKPLTKWYAETRMA